MITYSAKSTAMLRFFRRIRKTLFDQKRFSRYLLYALGEVVLVVIGILIALQLNNRSEERKQQEYAITSFEEVQKELMVNLKKVNHYMGVNYDRDIRIRKYLCGLPNEEVLLENWKNEIRIPFDAASARFESDILSKSISEAANLPEAYRPLILTLNDLLNTYNGIMYVEDRLIDLSVEATKETFIEIPWFTRQLERGFEKKYQKEGVAYLKGSDSFRVHLSNQRIGIENLSFLYYRFHVLSFRFFDQLKELNPEISFDYESLIEPTTLKLDGAYQITQDKDLDSVFPIEGRKLIYKDVNGRYFSKSVFFPFENTFREGEIPVELIHLGNNRFFFPFSWQYFKIVEKDGSIHLIHETHCVDQELQGIQTAD